MNLFLDYIIPYLCGFLEVLFEAAFFSKIAQKDANFIYNILFAVVGCILINLQLPVIIKVLTLILMLTANGIFLLKVKWMSSLLYAVLAVEIMQLCYGISNSVIMLISPALYPSNPALFSWIFMIAGNILALGLACLCCQILLKYFGTSENARNQSILMILTPLLLIFLVSGYINFTFYGSTISIGDSEVLLSDYHVQMLIVQLLGIGSIFCILYAYRKLTDSFLTSMKLSLLEQQRSFQTQYVEEARAHYDSTKSLRHDVKNHVSVVKGLLESEDYEKAKAYIDEMDVAATSMSFPFQTNNPVLDILLENKAALASVKDIHISSTLKVPLPCTVSDMDFCIILSNALDNAIHACEKLSGDAKKYIRISSHQQEDFLLIEVENSYNGNRKFKQGIGLNNIKWVTEKYGGTMDIGVQEKAFCLSILLVISQQPECISQQIK